MPPPPLPAEAAAKSKAAPTDGAKCVPPPRAAARVRDIIAGGSVAGGSTGY